MSFKEWTAVVEVVSAIVIGAWVAWQAVADPLAAGDLQALAIRLCWAIGYVIVFNIVAIIVVAILVSIVQREELKDEKDDERDREVAMRGGRNGWAVTSILAAAALLWLAFGADLAIAAYALFAAPMLGGAFAAAARVFYYRFG